MPKRKYWDPEEDLSFTKSELRAAHPDIQARVMKSWFLNNYVDPVHNSPYDSEEGGYIFIWGGPFNPNSELESEFGRLVSLDVIERIASELNGECTQWTKAPSAPDEQLSSAVEANTDFHETFEESLSVIDKLLRQEVAHSLRQPFYRMLYASVITTLETYLSDAFVHTVLPSRRLRRRFVESNSDFKERALKLSEIYSRYNQLEDEIGKYLLELVWHNMARVKALYLATLRVHFNEGLDFVGSAIGIRHDIVHRNGKRKDGSNVVVTKDNVTELLEKIRSFEAAIDEALPRPRRRLR
jgi:hypothetical protein